MWLLSFKIAVKLDLALKKLWCQQKSEETAILPLVSIYVERWHGKCVKRRWTYLF